jgi:hypothetical protein
MKEIWLCMISQLDGYKSLWITERNLILDHPFKYFLPKYKRKLKEIDSHLDILDLKIYELRKLIAKNE